MSSPSARSRRWSCALLLAWSVPLLLFGPVLHGRALLWHAHDDAGAHLHVLAEHEHAPHAEDAHAPWLVEEHERHAEEHHHGAPPAPGEHRESDCFVVSFAGPFLPGVSTRGALQQRCLRAASEALGALVLVRGELLPPRTAPPAWRQRAKLRSGAATVVATSHALLI